MKNFKYIESPYRTIPPDLVRGYSMGGAVPIGDWWRDDSNALAQKVWDKKYVESFKNRFTPAKIKEGTHGREPYPMYHGAFNLLSSFEEYNIRNQNIAVVGSATPWIETILLNMGNKVTTIEYNVPESLYPGLNTQDYWEFLKDSTQYDCIVSYSSIEHAGLGRYGDPLNPEEDIVVMKNIHKSLKADGLLIFGAPVGRDRLYWNVHRVYGRKRLPLIFKNFTELRWYGGTREALLDGQEYQPVVVLQK